MDFSLITGPTEQLVRDLLEYRLDGAPVNGPVRQPDLVETPVFEERLVLVTARRVTDLDASCASPRSSSSAHPRLRRGEHGSHSAARRRGRAVRLLRTGSGAQAAGG
ncbi:LysR substrate-binding domain-containing protein [Streptomyces sp. NPDC051445]|uniref:LysR substrate-binding domain-containing protein n=1 Tax=Streptomyces sp. NPDC051445 TaxID=3365653 RepID=UPI0037A809A9